MKRTFTILHTNDMHSNFIGMGPASDYTPFTLNDDQTRGGYARLSALIATRRQAQQKVGPVLTLDAGDFSMGTPFAAATRETGGELRLMSAMGYDATTFGNHEFDLGPEGLGCAITVATNTGPVPAILAANADFSADDPNLNDLQRLAKDGVIRRYSVLEREGMRFGLFGLLGKEAQIYTNGCAVKFPDPIETAKEIVTILRDVEKVDVIICLSHGGVEKDKDGRFTAGEDVQLPEAVPGIDIVIGGHSHTELAEPILVNGRTPVVQTGLEGRNLGELVISIDAGVLKVESYRLHPIDDSIAGDHALAEQIQQLKSSVDAAVFASRGYSIDQVLAITSQDLPNSFTDIAASTILANMVTDAFRKATHADIGFTAGGMIRAPLKRGKTGAITVYDVFAVAPLGCGVVDTTAGSALVTGYFTGIELKHLLEFFLIDNAAHPGEYFPRVSGMRFSYDKSRPMFDVVTAIELGDFDSGYTAIDISGNSKNLYSLTTSLMLAVILVAIPKYTKGALSLQAKNKEGQALTSRVDALEAPRNNAGFMMAPPGKIDSNSVALGTGIGALNEVKEWQAIMDYLCKLPKQIDQPLPLIPLDARAAEMRAIKAG